MPLAKSANSAKELERSMAGSFRTLNHSREKIQSSMPSREKIDLQKTTRLAEYPMPECMKVLHQKR